MQASHIYSKEHCMKIGVKLIVIISVLNVIGSNVRYTSQTPG
jgi:hypothetical protein